MTDRAPEGRDVLPVVLTVFIDLVGFGIVLPLIPFYATELGAGALEVGLIIGSYSAVQFVLAPVWGGLSDRFGRRPILLVGFVGSAASYLVFGFATTLAVLLLSRIIAGAMGANVAVAQASVADSSRPDRRARAMGLIGASFGLAFIVGPALGGILSRWGYALPGFVAAGLSATNALIAWFLLPESLSPENRSSGSIAAAVLVDRWKHAKRVLGRRDLFEPIIALSTGTVAFAAFTTTFPLFLKEGLGLGAGAAGGMFALMGLVTAITQGRMIGPLVERSGERRVAVRGAALMGAALLAFAWLTGVWETLFLLIPFGVGWGMLAPSLQSLVSRRAGHREQGEVLGVNQSMGSLARVIGPIAGGWMFGAMGFAWEFAAAGALMFAAAAWVLRMRPGAENGG